MEVRSFRIIMEQIREALERQTLIISVVQKLRSRLAALEACSGYNVTYADAHGQHCHD